MKCNIIICKYIKSKEKSKSKTAGVQMNVPH
jgi:hypothetical protein